MVRDCPLRTSRKAEGVLVQLDQMHTKFSSEWAQLDFSNFTVHGEPAGLFKNAGPLSYLRVFGAYVPSHLSLQSNVSADERDGLPSGHEVPAYKFGNLSTGEAALQMFAQIVGNNPLSAT